MLPVPLSGCFAWIRIWPVRHPCRHTANLSSITGPIIPSEKEPSGETIFSRACVVMYEAAVTKVLICGLPFRSPRLTKIALLALLISRTGSAFVLQNERNRGRLSGSVCFAQAVTPFVLRSDEESSYSSGEDPSEGKDQLSRPERKALERAKKENRSNQNHRKHDFAGRRNVLQSRRQPGEGRYDLHSKILPSLNESSSANDVMRAIKRAQNLHDAHDLRAVERFLLEQTDDSFAYGYRGSLLARLTVAALHMNNHDLALKALEERRTKHKTSILPLESAAIIRGLLRVHNSTDAQKILKEELSLPEPVSAPQPIRKSINVTFNSNLMGSREQLQTKRSTRNSFSIELCLLRRLFHVIFTKVNHRRQYLLVDSLPIWDVG